MPRAGKLMRMAVGLACLMVACTVLAPGMAAAATRGVRPVGLAGMAAQLKTVTTGYSCDLSKYGSGIPPVTLSATLKFPGTVAADSPLNITLNSASATLPPAVLSQLNGVTSVDLTATVTAQHASATSVPLNGQAQVPGQPAGLPAEAASGSVKFPSPGTGVVVGNSGPLYKCVVSSGGVSGAVLFHIPMTITSSGSRSTGHTLTVTMSSPDTGLGGPYLPGTTSISFDGSLPVQGAQPGKITLAKTTTDVTSATFRVSGKLKLTKPGTDQILVPDKFTFTLHGPTGTLPIVFARTIDTSPAPVGLTIKVAGAPVQPSSGATPTSGGGRGEGNGTPVEGNGTPAGGNGMPVGAPNTGGGSGADGMAMAVAGLPGAAPDAAVRGEDVADPAP